MSLTNAIDTAADWIVCRVSSKRAAMRAHFRRMASDTDYAQTVFALLHARGYRAASAARNSGQWTGSGGSADAEITTDLPALRNRSRELNRDDSIGSGITKTFVNNVIGTGLRPQSTSELEAVWNERQDVLFAAEDMDFMSAQRLVYGKVLEDGDHFVKHTRAAGDDALWCESIEGDRVDNWTDARVTPGNELRSGIERDAAGRPAAYHVARVAPGDIVGFGVKRLEFGKSVRVAKADCIQLKMPTRSGQTRGVPLFHAVLGELRDLDLLLLAALKRTQVAACLAAFIKTPVSTENFLQQTAKLVGFKLEQEIEPGMIWQLAPGEEVQSFVPNFPVPELVPFVVLIARKIGAALGISWQIILKDFGDASYSSARTNILESRATFVVQQQWFVNNLLRPLWIAVMQDARLRGDPRVAGASDADLAAVTWIAPGWSWVDPETEARATQICLQMGLTTYQAECAVKGRDWKDNLDQIADARAYAREKGVEDVLKVQDVTPKPAVAALPALKKKTEAA